LIDLAARRIASLGLPSPGAVLLGPLRRRALRETIELVRPDAERLAPALRAGDAGARGALADLGEAALAELRDRVRRQAAERGSACRLAARADALWSSPTEGEHIDDPALPAATRTRAMQDLDAMNGAFGAYELFLKELRPLLAPDRPTRMLDLAAGHGGFALALARAAAGNGTAIEITATDLRPEYLEIGRAEAEREGLPVRFGVQDALDLSNLAAGAYDVVVCTQALHHFPAGLVAVMFEAAARAAGRGVAFLDGCRSILGAPALVAFSRLRYANPTLAHDAYVSIRRFFVPEELELLARLGPWGDGVVSRRVPPGHCLLRLVHRPC
jgi:2-polyprenyl-3-methyl-5-hydroxy-6-metoxy-1,4-benzoquinol methylase